MKNEFIQMDSAQLDTLAKENFIRLCGFDSSKEKHRKLLETGMQVRENISGNISVKAVVSSFEGEVLSGTALKLGDTEFKCNAFEQIDARSVCKVFIYVLSAGNIEADNSSIMDMFYADTWGTAYVDAGREVLRKLLLDSLASEHSGSKAGQHSVFISDSFGPGFYGMDISCLGQLLNVVDSSIIDVRLSEGGMLIPQKSCAGFYIAAAGSSNFPAAECKDCSSNKKGCSFCSIKTIKNGLRE